MITYPRALPADVKFASVSFTIQYQQLSELAGGGVPQLVNVGADLWRARYRTVPLSETSGESMLAWISSLRGGMKLFAATNPLRRYTISRRAGYAGLVKGGTSTPFTGTGAGSATLSAITALRDGVSLTGLPAAFVLLPGDWLSIPVSASRVSLHRVVEGATATGAGLASVLVEPAVLADAVPGVSVDLASPSMLAVIDARSIRESWQRGRFVSIDFEAQQVFG